MSRLPLPRRADPPFSGGEGEAGAAAAGGAGPPGPAFASLRARVGGSPAGEEREGPGRRERVGGRDEQAQPSLGRASRSGGCRLAAPGKGALPALQGDDGRAAATAALLPEALRADPAYHPHPPLGAPGFGAVKKRAFRRLLTAPGPGSASPSSGSGSAGRAAGGQPICRPHWRRGEPLGRAEVRGWAGW